MFDPGLHNRVAVLIGQPFHGDDRLAGDLADTRLTGADRLSIDVDGARPALRHSASVLGACNTKFVAQTQSKGISGTTSTLMLGPIDRELDHVGCPLADGCFSSLPDRLSSGSWPQRQCLVGGRASVFTNPAGSCSICAESLCRCSQRCRRSDRSRVRDTVPA